MLSFIGLFKNKSVLVTVAILLMLGCLLVVDSLYNQYNKKEQQANIVTNTITAIKAENNLKKVIEVNKDNEKVKEHKKVIEKITEDVVTIEDKKQEDRIKIVETIIINSQKKIKKIDSGEQLRDRRNLEKNSKTRIKQIWEVYKEVNNNDK